jgi:hypothetical protein
MASNSRKKQNGPRCVWSDSHDAILIRTLLECKDVGMQSDSGWKPQVWPICAEKLQGGSGGEKTAEKAQDHYTNVRIDPTLASPLTVVTQLKASFNAVRKLRDLSGFGWDEGLKMVTASEDVWELYLAVCSSPSSLSTL